MGTLKGFPNPPVVALVAAALAAPGCAFPPWSMGAPLDGRPSIPATTAAPSIASLRTLAVAQRAAGHTALELKALAAIAYAQRLTADERARVIVLLERRARELLALGRAVPACEDLRELEERAPARGRALATLHAAAERDAGDAWLAVGDAAHAREAYEIAASLGAAETDFRLAAATVPPARVEPGAAERAVLELPLRAVPPYAEIYLDGGAAAGVIETDALVRRAALERAWRAARQERMRPLAERLHALLAAADPGATPREATPAVPGGTATERLTDALLDAPAAPQPSFRGTADPAALDDWVVGTAAVSTRLLLLLEIVAAQPEPGDRRSGGDAAGARRALAALGRAAARGGFDVARRPGGRRGGRRAGRPHRWLGAQAGRPGLLHARPLSGIGARREHLGAGGAGAARVRRLAARRALARRAR